MVKLKPEFISRNGRKEFAVLTIKDYERVMEALEDAEDIRILRTARRRNADSPVYTLNEVKRRLGFLKRSRKPLKKN
ncbi:MAG TPA: hypothetical protein VHD56_13690 [Tepidisphaeraceae bacterium]|nr:hypothetical protein [Tepidisphaeraceae bacterium]